MADQQREMMQAIIADLQARDFRAIQAQGMKEAGFSGTDGYFQVSSQRWFHPEVQARSGDRLFVYEVETEETLDQTETREKIGVLANAAAKANGRFFLVVPEELRGSAQILLHDLRIDWAEVLGIGAGRPV